MIMGMPDVTQPVVTVEKLGKKIKSNTILEPISFELEGGTCLSLCGGNGAGKSTLIRMLVGILPPSQGSIRFFGRDEIRLSDEVRSMIGYMPDQLIFPRAMTALDILQFYGALRGIEQRRISDVLEMVGLSRVADQKVGGFSKGMNQRLLLAQALLHNPPLILMDEPTGGLDPNWIITFETIVQQLKQQGTTVIFSTHDLRTVEQVTDRVIMLDRGKMLLDQSVKELKETYGTVEHAFFAFL